MVTYYLVELWGICFWIIFIAGSIRLLPLFAVLYMNLSKEVVMYLMVGRLIYGKGSVSILLNFMVAVKIYFVELIFVQITWPTQHEDKAPGSRNWTLSCSILRREGTNSRQMLKSTSHICLYETHREQKLQPETTVCKWTVIPATASLSISFDLAVNDLRWSRNSILGQVRLSVVGFFIFSRFFYRCRAN